MASASAEVAKPETVGMFLLSIPARSLLDPIIEHCSEHVPELKNDLLKERAAFIDKLTEAGKPLMAQLGNDPEFNAPVQEAMRDEIAKINSRALDMFKQQDPTITCRTGLTNIQNATVEGLRDVVEETYRRYRDAGQAKNPE